MSAGVPSSSPILEVRGLSVRRDGFPILSEVGWLVERGQHWTILGANGSGKTSLLAALTGYLTPSQGSIQLLGQRYGQANWPALRQRVGFVSSALRQLIHDHEPASEIVVGGRYAAIDLWEKPGSADLRRARQLLRLVDAVSLAERPWGFLSQGERQRILIARGLMARPDLLILDEPCAGLDPVARERFLAFISDLGQRPCPALVLVTHHVEEIMPVFGHALVLHGGRVLAAGPTGGTLSSSVLSRAFGATVLLRRHSGRYTLKVSTRPPGKAWQQADRPARP
jgi:iron complex transport system ATP-binding protein